MPEPGPITTIKEESSRQSSASPERVPSAGASKPGPPPTQPSKPTASVSTRASRTNLAQGSLPPKSVRMSQGNLMAGSRSNLRGSRNLMGSKFGLAGSRNKLNAGDGEPVVERITYENTFQTKPDKKFRSEMVQRLVKDLLETRLNKVTYNAEKVPELTKSITNEILQEVKKLNFDRYKFVVEVNIGEFKGQGVRVASRSLADVTTDSYASASFRNAHIFAAAMVFGIYYE
ncbi:Tctex-1-domain-containing protein [Gonapodya prolifera JEL478]|uniref:Tctex-1-domain-containing protein n=1 Tax=Gonapodya prolifera (strain JEL478) TaxID=1344416 RepID=A0A139AB40_GONPJ|nr:Tctex-1-domain-containing protein [Gonapodya prolifera JEL478]|eukprot:KXS13879.1 Tctex-1-domain-containing protein [Gonapodya prolifera JEL478]